MKRILAIAAIALPGLGSLARADITTETVKVGNVGNTADPATGRGSIGYAYNIGKYEVTAGEYGAFLNAVAKTDTYGLYNPAMSQTYFSCRISQRGASGSYDYTVDPAFVNRPVTFVSFWDACRFCNWLSNGQKTGAQDVTTTERGTYTLDGYIGNAGGAIQRHAGAKWAVPTEDEWYKAAYYDPNKPGGAGYWLYPTRSMATPGRDMDDPSGNNANWSNPASPDTTVVGAFHNSASGYGTFDQGGNVWEWNEAIPFPDDNAFRGIRGGAFDYNPETMQSSFFSTSFFPTVEGSDIGFRVVDLQPDPIAPSAFAAVTPATGRTNGGTVVTLTGSNFLSGATVRFDGFGATALIVNSPTRILAATPAHAPGVVNVTVLNPNGRSANYLNAFTYVLPPPPARLSAAGSAGNDLWIVWTGGANQPCVLLSGTNLAQPMSTWTPVATNAVGPNGFSTNVIPINPGEPQRWYILSIP